MQNSLLRFSLTGLADANDKLVAAGFEINGCEYFVHNIRFDKWIVHKVTGDSTSYDVTKERTGLTCNCMSGARHLLCRHKQMVQTLENERNPPVVPRVATREELLKKLKEAKERLRRLEQEHAK
jgi:hypothetical protein